MAKPGDIVCADGSFYSPEEYVFDATNYPIGICYFAETYKLEDGRSAQRRLMAGAAYTAIDSISSNSHSACFGPTAASNPDDILTGEQKANFNIPGLDGITEITGFSSDENLLETEDLYNRNNTYVDNIERRFINKLPKYSLYGQLGFIALTKAEAEILGEGYSEGDILPYGKKNTLLVLKFRDRILGDSNINLPKPKATEDKTQLKDAEDLMIAKGIVSIPEQKGASEVPNDGLLYFPVFTVADSYVPKVGPLSVAPIDKFREGNWFVPATGDLVRLNYYYIRHIDTSIKDVESERAVDGTDFSKTFEVLNKVNLNNFGWSRTSYIHTSSVLANTSISILYMLGKSSNISTSGLFALDRRYSANKTILCCEF
jgi:hypothetical protein